MAGTVIVSDETMRQLIEAHASMAAWFYQMSGALHAAGLSAEPPSEELRRAFVAQVGAHFPELGAIATAITSPRPYLPPPVFLAAPEPAPVAHAAVPIAPAPIAAAPIADVASHDAAPVAPPASISPNLQESAPPAMIAQQASTQAEPSPPAWIVPSEGRQE